MMKFKVVTLNPVNMLTNVKVADDMPLRMFEIARDAKKAMNSLQACLETKYFEGVAENSKKFVELCDELTLALAHHFKDSITEEVAEAVIKRLGLYDEYYNSGAISYALRHDCRVYEWCHKQTN